jgi:hypothetical protein
MLLIRTTIKTLTYTDKKRKYNFPHVQGNSEGSDAKLYMTNGLLIYDKIFLHFLIY